MMVLVNDAEVVVEPVDHTYLYGAVPPVRVAVALPSHTPPQDALFLESANVRTAGCVTVAVYSALHPFLSLIVSV
jgi:hypothetical protein